jgi:hypothetical protein
MAATVIRNFIAKKLFQKKGAIANNKAVEFSANALEQRLINLGIDPNAIRSEKELNQILGLVKQAEDRAFNERFGNVLSRSNLERKGEVFDMTGKKINPSKGIMGGKEINEQTLKEGLMKTDNPFSDLVNTPRPKTIKEREAEVIARFEKENKAAAERIRNRKMVEEAIDNASPGFAGDRKYDAQLVADSLAEKRFNKEFYDLDQKQQMDLYDEALEGLADQKRDMPDPEDFAQGGRAGFSKGSGLKTLFDFLNKNNPAQAYSKYLKSVKDRMKAGKEAEVAGEVIPIAAGGALITNQLKKKLKAMNEEQKKEFKKDMEKKADGGRIGLKDGPKLSDFIDVQASGSKSGKQQIMGAPEGITIDEESINAIIKADIPISQKIDLLADYQYGKGRTRIEKDNQEIFLDEGGFKNRNVGFGFNKAGEGIGGTLMYNLETGEPQFNIGFKKRFANGGRIGLAKGMTKRAFLKLMGGAGAGIAALKSGLLGIGKGTATKQVVKEVADQGIRSTPPPYFFELANKIKTLGKPDKVTYADRVDIHRYTGKNGDEYELIEDLNTGDMRIQKDKMGGRSYEEGSYEVIEDRSVLEYRKGETGVKDEGMETQKSFKEADEYEEYKVEFDQDGTEASVDNLDEVIQKEILEEATGEAPSIKKAGGGIARMLGE